MQRRDAEQLRLHGDRLVGADRHDVVHPGGERVLADLLQGRELGLVGRHDQLAAAPVVDAPLGAIAVEPFPPLDADLGLEAALGVIEAGVDDLAVARAGPGADQPLGLQHHHVAAGHGERPRDREAHHARADHCDFDLVHSAFHCRLRGTVPLSPAPNLTC